MNSVIEWLFQRTSDGATYLQIIIVGILFICMINWIFKIAEDVRDCLKKEDE